MTAGDIEKGFAAAGASCASSDKSVAWVDENGALKAMKPGTADITVVKGDGEDERYRVTLEKYEDGSDVAGNANIGIPFSIEVYENTADMVKVTYSDADNGSYTVTASKDGVDTIVPVSGYLVKKGSVLIITPMQTETNVISAIKVNGKSVAYDSEIIADSDTDISVSFKKAEINGVPETITLAKTGDSYKLNASVRYSGVI